MTLFRAAILNPTGPHSWDFYPDGGLVIRNGLIEAIGAFDDVAGHWGLDPVILNGIILPGFADVHIHWVQHAVRGRFSKELMPWLRTHIWPEEARYADSDFAQEKARCFFSDLLSAGTVMGMAYSSPHIDATTYAYSAMRGDWMMGNTIMTSNAPGYLTQVSARVPADLLPLYATLGRAHYAVTPRFALNCTADELAALGAWSQSKGLYVQTHLAESVEEIREVKAMFPEAIDYTDIYDRAGLLGARTVLGHCIHMSEREWRCLKARRCWIAHCPSSNEALDSGRFDIGACRHYQIPFALATDVGAGPSHSMLHVMQRFLRQHRAAGISVDAQEALFRATLGGAQCMGRASHAGNLQVGKRGDFVLMPKSSGQTSLEAWLEELIDGNAADLENRPLDTWIAGRSVRHGTPYFLP